MRHIIQKALSHTLFGMLLLFSLLPLWFLYILSDILGFILYHIIRYRRDVVFKNMKDSLPQDSDIPATARKFYRFLAETVVESVKCLTISKSNLHRRITCDNPEVMEEFYRDKRSVILMSCHYGNWEYLIYAMNHMFPHLAVGVGKPLTNKTLNKLINDKRSRFGMKIINATNIREEFQKDKDILTASLFLSDQYPGHGKPGFQSIFLNKETGFMYGAEKYAKDYNFPVVYADVERLGRGRYKIHLEVISAEPAQTEYGYIMSSYVSLLERNILRSPAFWLWSHMRWKHIEGFYN